VWKFIRRFLLGLAALLLLSIVIIYIWSSMIFNQKFTAVDRTITLTTAPEVLAEGKRKAQIFGCFHGCHGESMQGNVYFDKPIIARLVAPNLTHASRNYTPTEMEALVRQGIRPDGSGLKVMPSSSFTTMTDEDITAILSFIDQFPEQASEPGKSSFGPVARVLTIAGKMPIATSKSDATPWSQTWLNEPLKLGEYLTMNACSECHGLTLEGSKGFAPHLAIAKAYDREQFHALLEEGKALGERDIGLMGEVIQFRFSQLQTGEVDAIYDFLQSR
jgi:cytochrome c553